MITQFFEHDVLIDGVRVNGVQNVSQGLNLETNRPIIFGDSTAVAEMYGSPTISFSFTKVLTSHSPKWGGPFDIRDWIFKRPVKTYSAEIALTSGASVFLDKCWIKTIRFNFPNVGNFTQDVEFEGRVSEIGPSTITIKNEEGTVYRRQHFTPSVPGDVPAYPLINVSVELNINYSEPLTYGGFKIYESQMVDYPCQVSSTFEVYDLGYNISRLQETNGLVNDLVAHRDIVISSVPVSINLGDKNTLTSIERSGADAGTNDYSTLKFTYINQNNFFTYS